MSRPDATAMIRAMITISDHLSMKIDLPLTFPLLRELSDRRPDNAAPLPTLMTPPQAASILGVSEKTLANYRVSGVGGPPHVKNGGRVYYRRQDVVDHIEDSIRASTSQRAAPGYLGVPRRGPQR